MIEEILVNKYISSQRFRFQIGISNIPNRNINVILMKNVLGYNFTWLHFLSREIPEKGQIHT